MTAAPARVEHLLDGDYSDPDVVLVDGVFWMITSTIHLSPGMAVLRSQDMRHWEHVGHVVDDLTRLGPAYRRGEVASRFGRGVYAGSIRHHDGRFWVHFTTLDEGIFVCTATDPAGAWSPPHRLSDARMWDDPCPLWEEDGRAWLVASNPGPSEWFSYLIPMSTDGMTLHLDQRRVVDDRHTSEGNKLYRHDGWYYLLHNEVHGPGDRLAVVLRTRELAAGTWEKRVLVRGDGLDRSREPNQGSLLADADGNWWFLTHHGRTGYPEGRPLSRIPLAWRDGWPVVVGEAGPTGRAVLDDRVVVGSVGPRDDDFPDGRPGPQWEWVVTPGPGEWSVGEGASRLRLHPGGPAEDLSLRGSPTALTQRTAGRPGSATVWIDGSALGEGDVAALGHHCTTTPVALGVQRRGQRLHLLLIDGLLGEGCEEVGELPVTSVQLRTDVDARSRATFGFRTDPAAEHEPVGDSYPLVFAHYRGSRIALFALGAGRGGGSADFREFRYAVTGEGGAR